MPDPQVKSIAEATAYRPLLGCMVTQVTPLLVSFDGGVTSVPADKVTGLTYTIGTSLNARAILDSPNKPLVFPIG